MTSILALAAAVFGSFFKGKRALVLENLALRQQLAVYKRVQKRPRLGSTDRAFWVWLFKIWDGWKTPLILVRPETVIRWHRQGFKRYWRWRSRPATSKDILGIERCICNALKCQGIPFASGAPSPSRCKCRYSPDANPSLAADLRLPDSADDLRIRRPGPIPRVGHSSFDRSKLDSPRRARRGDERPRCA